jgi:hypothetical protein
MSSRSGTSQAALPLARIRRLLVLVLGAVIYAGLSVEFIEDILGIDDAGGLKFFFSLSHEQNLPTWVSSCLLFSCGTVLALIASDERRRGSGWVRHWRVLSLIFFYISLDELASLHEYANHWFRLGGVLYFGWVIPAGIIVTIVALSYLRFLAALPERVRRRFLVAGGIYVGGALGVELILAYWTDVLGDKNFGYSLIDLVEESMEMIGASLFLLALLEHLGSPAGEVRIQLATERPAGSRAGPEDPGSGSGGPAAP